ncbi:hypothetical protein ACHHYP_04094 [Achlya hypogyna]|uniref:Uncharacterized protein n=1 Tax=Achlya hypogyna TaxID=1202772 RepID=A0A1V9Z269_ACHHY|nr:hypothetical protein ACHHYP_04094 [Achlya hypogyna]
MDSAGHAALLRAYFRCGHETSEAWGAVLGVSPTVATAFTAQLLHDPDPEPSAVAAPPQLYVGMWPHAYYKLLAHVFELWATSGTNPALQLPPTIDGVIEDRRALDRILALPVSVVRAIDGTFEAMDAFVHAVGGARGLLTLLGVRCTIGSQIVCPPTRSQCMAAFNLKHGGATVRTTLTVGARQWTKHAQRSLDGWWGTNKGSEAAKNALGDAKVTEILDTMVWMNTHGLPNGPIVLEVRQQDGYGARWGVSGDDVHFRGFVEPYMEDGHASGWIH